jgi:nitrile hydratase
MNGIHDMGGMHGMGAVAHEPNEPVFHEAWEGRAWGLLLAMGRWTRGGSGNPRYELERIPPADYLRMSYYERWFHVLVNRLLRSDVITAAELASGKADATRPKPTLSPRLAGAGRSATDASETRVKAGFRLKQHVRARNMNPEGHTRLPRYVRGKRGTVVRDNGVFALQDTDLNGQPLGGRPQHVYTVRFAARELWGSQASSHDWMYVDLWEDYLEHA